MKSTKSTKSVQTRLQRKESIWSTITKRKLKTFKTQVKMMKKKVDVRVIQLNEERSLLSRFLITSRKRPDLDLEHCFGNFKFTVVPRSLFTSDGEPLACEDKWKVLHNMDELGAAQVQEGDGNCASPRRRRELLS